MNNSTLKDWIKKYTIIIIILSLCYTFFIIEDIHKSQKFSNIFSKLVLYGLPILFFSVHFIKSRKSFTQSSLNEILTKRKIKKPGGFDFLLKFNKIETNWDQYFSLIFMFCPFLFFLYILRFVMRIILLSLIIPFFIFISLTIGFHTYKSFIHRKELLKKIEDKIENSSNTEKKFIKMYENYYIIVSKTFPIVFPWISVIISIIPPVLEFLINLSLI